MEKEVTLTDEVKKYIDKAIENKLNKTSKETEFGVIATSKLAKVEIADRNYIEGDKKYFTYDEALEVEKKLKPTGWRLPTRSEWVLICEEFGQRDGRLNAGTLAKQLKLEHNGWYDFNNEDLRSTGYTGYYWSSSPYSNDTYAYHLYFNASGVYPSYNYNRYLGFSLRLVRDVEEEE